MTSVITLAPRKKTHKCVPRGDGKKRKLTTSKDFIFQAFAWDVQDLGEGEIEGGGWGGVDDDREHTIFISGAREDGHSVTVETTFSPYFLLKVGYTNDEDKRWTTSQIKGFIDEEILSTLNKKNKSTPRKYYFAPDLQEEEGKTPEEIKEEKHERSVRFKFESSYIRHEELLLHDLDAGFTGIEPKKFQFIRLMFKTECAAKACSRLFTKDDFLERMKKAKRLVKLYEANLDSHMRLMHLTGCQSAGWIKIPAKKYLFCIDKNTRNASSDIEIKLPKWQDMEPYEHESIAPLRECSFDLETYSPEDDKFSNAEVRDNYIIQIATTFSDFGTGRCTKVLYTYKNIDPIDEPDTIVKEFDTERQMLIDWAELISNSDPETVHAYNGWEFDYGYLAIRAKVNRCWDIFRSKLGRIKTLQSNLLEKQMSSKAYGDNFWKLLTMSGRVVFDPMVHIQREFKLNFYNLKSVSEEFLAQKLPKNPFTTTQGSNKLLVRHPKHGLAANKVIHFSDIDTPDICVDEEEDKIYYALAGWNYEVLHELHTITKVISPDEYVIEMPSPATKTLKSAGGSVVKAFETKHDISFPDMFRAWREQDTKILHKVGRYCLSEDSQILTNKGFLFLDQILNENHKDLLICGYDDKKNKYVYERASDIIVNKEAKQEMIEFTNHNESLRWGEGSDDYGRYTESHDGYSNNVSLIVTPEHDMYRRFGRYRKGNKGKADCFEKRKNNFEKKKAGSLISTDETEGCQFLAFAENGISKSNTKLPVVDILDLKSTEQVDAFLRLYGYWLGDGSFQFKGHARDSITFQPVKKQDVDYLIDLLNTLKLESDVDYIYSAPIRTRRQHSIRIITERYTSYFRSQYQENYKSYEKASNFVQSDNDRQVPEEGPKTDKWLWSWCWDLSKEQCRHLIAGLRFADGSETANRNVIFTSSVRFRDEILRLCLHAGYSATFKSMYLKEECRGIDKKTGKPFIATKDAWTVEYSVKNVIRPALKSHRDIKKISYTGRTWCVTVPHGFIVTRRAFECDGVITKASRPTIQGNCIQDTMLPQKILDKLCVIPNLIEMAKCTWVPLEYLITRGQQIKVFSQICKASREAGYAVPTLQKKSEDDEEEQNENAPPDEGFIGGAVLEPFVGYYDEPIAVPDFKSLYPCTMIDNNFCFTTLVKNKKYMNQPDVLYNNIKVGSRTNTFAMNYDGIVPQILVDLLNARGRRKKLMAAAKTPLERMIHNGAQLALKVSANSIYGFMGVSPDKAMLPCMEIAESTTSKGRDGTFTSRDYAENPDNFKDIVQCDYHFPLNYPYLINKKGKCFHLTAQALLKVYKITFEESGEGTYLPIQEPKSTDGNGWVIPVDGPSFGMQVWTDAQWDDVTGVSRVRRDYIEGDLIRFHTAKGSTLDMQNFKARVIAEQRCKMTVKDEERNVEKAIDLSKKNICTVVYGDSVTGDTPLLVRKRNKVQNEVHIVAISEFPRLVGTQQFVDWSNGFKLDGEDRREKERIDVPEVWEIWTDEGWKRMRKLIRHKVSKQIYQVNTMNGRIRVTEDHSLVSEEGERVKPGDLKEWTPLKTSFPKEFPTEKIELTEQDAYGLGLVITSDCYDGCQPELYDSENRPVVPSEILTAPLNIRKSFLEGCSKTGTLYCVKHDVTAQGIYYLLRSVGYKGLKIYQRKGKVYIKVLSKRNINGHRVKSVEKLYETIVEGDVVYDIETETGKFHAGVGELTAFNTDSIFVLYDSTHLKHLGQPMRVAYCEIVAAFVADRITDYLREQNPFKPKDKQWMELEYEKTYRCFILFSKKRYSGEMTEFDPFSYSNDNKGTSKKRRDFCSFVKEIYGKIIKELFSEDESLSREDRINNALEVVKKAVEDLLNNRVPFNKLVISKLLKSHYAVRNKVQSKASKGCDFHRYNIFKDDKIICRRYTAKKTYVCECVVTHKYEAEQTQLREKPPLTVKVTDVLNAEEGETTPYPKNTVLHIRYYDIHEKLSSVMYLEKIMDPNTPEQELEPIKQAHVRLARKMNLRDPATAPPSGTRVGYVFCESKNKSDLQYLKAESPEYAMKHKLKVDPIYYLKKQCANAWSQILDTVQPGLIGQILEEAYTKYNKRVAGQTDISAFFGGGVKKAEVAKTIEIKSKPRLDKKASVKVKRPKGTAKAPPKNSIKSYFAKK